VTEKKDQDDLNWFGVKVGTTNAVVSKGSAEGVGKYLNLKRPAAEAITATAGGLGADESKKRKIGFGDFEGW
jgi:peptidyl-prolyl cis-trans isomerase-like protein 2